MQTTVIYDSYISGRSLADQDKNNGTLSQWYLSKISQINYVLLSWGTLPEDLTELKLNLNLYYNGIGLLEYTAPGTSSVIYPTDLTCKIDLYALQSPFDELTVTWNNAPKRNLLQADFISVQSNVTQDIVLDLTPFSGLIPYGIMLVINNYIDEDFANKYNKQQGVYPYYAISSIELGFRSSESTNPPVLIYNIGSRPPAPVLTAPLPWTVVNKTDTGSIVFEWQSEDQVARIIEYSQDNGLTWIADEAITQDKTFTLTTAELGYGNLLVRVKSKNSTGLYSDYSNQLYMQIGERPGTPVISITGANTATPKATWATDPRQYGYQAQVYKGVDIIEDGGEVSGNINSYSIKTRLENNQTYTIKARIRDQYGIWSNYGSTDILVSFLTPPQPQISVFPQYPRAYNLINITNPAPSAEEEATVQNEIWRRPKDGEWGRIAAAVGSEYKDYTPLFGQNQEYMVRAVGQNGYKDSAVIVSTINNKGAQIAIVGEYDNWMQLTYNPQRSQFEGANGELMYFAGREKAVAEFDEHSSNDLNATYTVKTAAELNKFRQLAYSKKTLLYRDGRGRKIFGNIMTRFTINEERKRYTISFTFSETDYNEVV